MPLALVKAQPKAKSNIPAHITMSLGNTDEERLEWDTEVNRQVQLLGLGSKADLLRALIIIASVNDAVMVDQINRLKNGQQAAAMSLNGAGPAKPASKAGK